MTTPLQDGQKAFSGETGNATTTATTTTTTAVAATAATTALPVTTSTWMRDVGFKHIDPDMNPDIYLDVPTFGTEPKHSQGRISNLRTPPNPSGLTGLNKAVQIP